MKKNFYCFQFVSNNGQKSGFRFTLYKSKTNKALIINVVIIWKRTGRVCLRVRIRFLSSGHFFKSRFWKGLRNAFRHWNCKQGAEYIRPKGAVLQAIPVSCQQFAIFKNIQVFELFWCLRLPAWPLQGAFIYSLPARFLTRGMPSCARTFVVRVWVSGCSISVLFYPVSGRLSINLLHDIQGISIA